MRVLVFRVNRMSTHLASAVGASVDGASVDGNSGPPGSADRVGSDGVLVTERPPEGKPSVKPLSDGAAKSGWPISVSFDRGTNDLAQDHGCFHHRYQSGMKTWRIEGAEP